jgi:hypothetical protein
MCVVSDETRSAWGSLANAELVRLIEIVEWAYTPNGAEYYWGEYDYDMYGAGPGPDVLDMRIVAGLLHEAEQRRIVTDAPHLQKALAIRARIASAEQTA